MERRVWSTFFLEIDFGVLGEKWGKGAQVELDFGIFFSYSIY